MTNTSHYYLQDVLEYFINRVHYCLMELQSTILSDKDRPVADSNFMKTIETILEILNTTDSSSNIAEILGCVDCLLSQVLLFRNIILDADKGKLLEMCKCVLSKKLALQELHKSANQSTKTLAIEDLRRSVLEIEDLLNNCVLSVIVDALIALQDGPIRRLEQEIINERTLPADTAWFDLLMDRLIQLGLIGVGCTESSSGRPLFLHIFNRF